MDSVLQERFQQAAFTICDRWRQVFSVIHQKDEYWAASERVDAVKEQIGADAVGSVRAAVQADSEDFLQLWAHKRLDLTLEALCLRPAWTTLFSSQDRTIAANRLLHALASPEYALLDAPNASDFDLTVRWLNEQTISWDRGTNPRSMYSSDELADGADLSWCEATEQCATKLRGLGIIPTSIEQRRHYRSCTSCSNRWPELDSLFTKYETRQFDSCRSLLQILLTCLNVNCDRATLLSAYSSVPSSMPFPRKELEGLAWRAIVCAARVYENGCVSELLPIPHSAAHQDSFVEQLISSLTDEERFALRFAHEVTSVYPDLQEKQWFLYEEGETVMHLPSEGDLAEIPGVLHVLSSNEVSEWKRLLLGSDSSDESSEHMNIDVLGLFLLLVRASGIDLGPRNRFSVLSPSRESDDQQDVVATALQVHSNEISSLQDTMESNSAVQVPILDTLQDLVRKMEGASRYKAEENLRTILGEIYDRLVPSARNAAIVAEYCWLDANFPDPGKVVIDLATAFERQLREGIFMGFCKYLVANGCRD